MWRLRKSVIGAAFLTLLGSAGQVRAQDRAKVSCIAENHEVETTDAKTRQVETHDNWMAICTIKQGSETLWQERLVLPYPASWEDASAAITEFRTKRATEILKNRKKEKKP